MVRFILLAIFYFICFYQTANAKAILLDETTDNLVILPQAEVFLDESSLLSSFSKSKLEQQAFKAISSNSLSYGFNPNINIWIRFSLQNNSQNTLSLKLIDKNSTIGSVVLYAPENNYKAVFSGRNHPIVDKMSKPTFDIFLKKDEIQTYYLKVYSHNTAITIEPTLFKPSTMFEREYENRIFLFLIFGGLLSLLVYNFFIYLFTKDISHLTYVCFVFSVIIHQLSYHNLGQVYLWGSLETTLMQYGSLFSAVSVFFMALFTKNFLSTAQYPKIDKILKGLTTLLLLIIIATLFGLDISYSFMVLLPFFMVFLLFLLFIGVYALLKGNLAARYYIPGWSVVLFSALFMSLNSLGISSFYTKIPNLYDIALLFEAIIFSIGLAARIKHLQLQKQQADARLILQQKGEKERLEETVQKRTLELKNLLKELHHRVKNNLQMIISLLRLQSNTIKDEKAKEVFLEAQNRIKSMGKVHELLYQQDEFIKVNVRTYLEELCEELCQSSSLSSIVEVKLEGVLNLPIQKAIYTGLIINEVIQNSLKHAFNDNNGIIKIVLKEEANEALISVSDNGKGYDLKTSNDTLGISLIHDFCEYQLDAKLSIESKNGTQYSFRFAI